MPSLKMCEISQQKKYLSEDTIKKVLDEKYNEKCIDRWAYILHDKDVYTEADEKINEKHKQGTLKEEHWHIMLHFADSQNTKYIANWFGIGEQFVSKCTSKSTSSRKRFDDMLSYLIHKNDETKFQYSPNSVEASFDYNEFILVGGRTTRLAEILKMVADGTIREFNYTYFITYSEYDKYKKHIENAYQYRRDKLYTGDRKMEVIFITGSSGSGKTSYAKWLAKQKKLSFHVTGSGDDFLDGYKGQDCLILDDIRSSSMKFNEFIKLCDNHTDSNVKSRYHNKYLTECKLLIITSVFGIEEFYKGVFEESNEPLVQFKRRCTMYLNMDKYKIKVSQYDKHKEDYIFSCEFENPIVDLICTTQNAKTDKELITFFGLTPIRKIKGLNLEKRTDATPSWLN